MCETRHELKVARTVYKSENTPVQAETEVKAPRQQRVPRDSKPRARGEGPRDGEKKEWTLVGTSEQKPRVRKNLIYLLYYLVNLL